MRKLFWIAVVLVALLVARAASADGDGLGLSFFTEDWEVCQDFPPYSPFTIYLVAEAPSYPDGLTGVACRVLWPANLIFLGWQLPGIIPDPPDPQTVQYSGISPPLVPLPGESLIWLASGTFMALDPGVMHFHLGPALGETELLIVDAFGTVHSIEPSNGNIDWPVAAVNDPDCPVLSAEAQSWSTVKSLFR